MVEDLCGDPAVDLVLMAGNQYMVVPDLVDSFLSTHRSIGSVFYETLPPGVRASAECRYADGQKWSLTRSLRRELP